MTTATDDAKIRAKFGWNEARIQFLQENSLRLRGEFPDKFVVFRGEAVFDVDDDLYDVVKRAETKGYRGGRDFWVQFFPADIEAWMRSWRP
jgi:hypothetical protein